MLTCQRAARLSNASQVNTKPEFVNTPCAMVNTAQEKTRNADRHKPGYMAEYMRKRRAKG